MQTGWDYSDLAELASSHGNPEQLIIDTVVTDIGYNARRKI